MALSNITDNLKAQLQEGGTALKDVLAKSAENVKKVNADSSKAMETSSRKFSEAGQKFNDTYESFSSGIDESKNAFMESATGFVDVFKNFGSNFKEEQDKRKKTMEDASDKAAESYKSIFEGGTGAIKELTMGIVDIQSVVDDGVKMVKAAGTLVATPFKALNTTIAKTTKFFTGKEFNIGERMSNFFFAAQAELDEDEMGPLPDTRGVFTKLGDRLSGLRDNMIDGAKTLGKSGKELASKGFASLVNGLKFLGKNFMRMAASMAAALVPLLISVATFVAGLIAKGIALLVAAAPFIGIALLIGLAVAAVVLAAKFIYDKFMENKDLIMEKFQAMKDKVASIVGNIVSFFTNIWQGISDFIREKVLKIKSFLGLTSDEEEAELAAINERKAKKKDQRKRAEEAAQAEMDYMEETGQLEGMSRREKRKLRKQKEKEQLARIEEQDEYDAQSSEELMERRDAGRNLSDAARRQMEEKEQYINTAVATGEMTRNGEEVTDMDERRAMAQRSADARFGTDEELRKANQEGINEAIRAEMTLSGRDDYISARELTDEEDAALMAKYNLTEEDLEPENISQFDEDQNAYFAERDRLDGDRIKDARDAAEEMSQMPPKPTQLQSNAAVQQNNNVNNTFRVERPTPRNNEPTGTRLSQVPA